MTSALALKATHEPSSQVAPPRRTCCNGSGMDSERAHRNAAPSAALLAKLLHERPGIVIPNKTAASGMAAGVLVALALLLPVALPLAPTVTVEVDVPVVLGVPVAVTSELPLEVNDLAGVRLTEVEGVPVCDLDAVVVSLAVLVALPV